MDSLKVMATIESGGSTDGSSCPSPTCSISTARMINISPIGRRESAGISFDESEVLTLPVPADFADSRRASQIQAQQQSGDAITEKVLLETASTLIQIETERKPNELRGSENAIQELDEQPMQAKQEQRRDSGKDSDADKTLADEEKEFSSLMSTISNEELSIASDILDLQQSATTTAIVAAATFTKSFVPRKGSDGEDVNGHICHIDSPESDTCATSEVIHGESLMDDISSMLGEVLGLDSVDNSYTDDTTLFPSDIERKMSLKRDSLERKRRSSRAKSDQKSETKADDDTQFGFENRVFMTTLLDNRLEMEQPKYCSLAQFVEAVRPTFPGNDIARKSFKRKHSKKKETVKLSEKEAMSREEKEEHGEKEDEEKEKDDQYKFPQVSVIVEPPSPVLTEQIRAERVEQIRIEIESVDDADNDQELLTSKTDKAAASNHSSSSNLLGIGNEHFLTRSPAATRRISCCSMLNPAETAALAAAAATTKFYSDATEKKSDKKDDKDRKLPIINPLVHVPTWPNVSTGGGFISKCLLANADTLCAAVSPLIDPDETLSEGFYERCVMNNYFGIGIDAKISLDFHHKREEHPEKCRSRAKNYMWYGVLGSKQWLQKTYKNLEQRVQLECDGQRIPLPSLQGIVILNIPSFMGGINFWGTTKEGDIFLAPSFDDKILEVVAVFGSVQMAASRLINLQHHRIAQCQSIQINILGEEGVPIQVDGEAWIQPPGIIRILHKNRMQMLCRNRSLENSLKSWEEKQRQSMSGQGAKPRLSISHDKGRSSLTRQSMPVHEKSFLGVNIEKIRQHSFSGAVPFQHHHAEKESAPIVKEHKTVHFMDKPIKTPSEPDILFSEEEHHLLIGFIECTTTLTKWIKILAISYSLETDLYSLANKVDACLERVHPNGKILEGPELREEFTKLVEAVKKLYEESCCLLHDRGDKLKLREDLESKLSGTLANTELELRKCVMYDTPHGSLVYLQPLQGDQSEHKRKGLFWLKFRGKGSSLQTSQKREVANWGTQEVATWLETLQLSEYIDSFEKNDIRGRELLTLARRDLKDLGVTKVGHVKRILQAIKDLTQGL
ncbi:unnamed protein product [Acanthoscelides obtectus]|uniref:SAM domain-containing protein n=1 Tax=Acanthoscelides obtectus TaxID=200917 RepID=A0A9P0L198_ACAOB|nr:unnamed protein product [Acanthoscelides obtectus]CAK1677073.1 Diacylglycerol kinase eta [Acanthoscelides obtectus]